MLANVVKSAKSAIKKLSFSDVVSMNDSRAKQHQKTVDQAYRELLVGTLDDQIDGSWLDDAKPIIKLAGKTFEGFQRDRARLQLQIKLEIESAKAESLTQKTKELKRELAALHENHARVIVGYQSEVANLDRQIAYSQGQYSSAMNARQKLSREYPNSSTAKAAAILAAREVSENRLATLSREKRVAGRELSDTRELLADRLRVCCKDDHDNDSQIRDWMRDVKIFEDRCHLIDNEIESVEKSLEKSSATIAA